MAEHKKVKYYYDPELAGLLAGKISRVYKGFENKSFIHRISSQVSDLEYKDRVRVFAGELNRFLPAQYDQAVEILLSILGPENERETGMFTEGYWIAPIAYFVERFGVEDYATSMHALAEITKRHTSEYAVRPYLEKYPDKALNQMVKWSKDKNFHLRRLASEGVRPRLPWAKMLPEYVANPEPILPILESLKADNVKYVQKSVANCIGDVLKDNPEIGFTLLERWVDEDPAVETRWIIRHSLRKPKKSGDPRALEVLQRLG